MKIWNVLFEQDIPNVEKQVLFALPQELDKAVQIYQVDFCIDPEFPSTAAGQYWIKCGLRMLDRYEAHRFDIMRWSTANTGAGQATNAMLSHSWSAPPSYVVKGNYLGFYLACGGMPWELEIRYQVYYKYVDVTETQGLAMNVMNRENLA